jgi:hypothetical protein
LVDYLQNYLIENKTEWIEQNFNSIYQISFQSNSLLELQKFCIDFMAKSPEKVFKSLDFISLSEESLVSLIKRDDLQMKEVEVWDHVLKWGLEKNSTFLPDPTTWSDDDFKMMKNTLQHILPLIRFFSLSSDELVQQIRPYKKLLNDQLYEELMNSYLDSNSKPNDNILLPRYRNIDGIIDSKIVNLNIASLISRWIDKFDNKSKFSYTREFYLPYKFKLLLRGSQDGFTPNKFHESCDDIPCTLTLIKVKETEEIIGGYNPTVWKSSDGYYGEHGQTKDSFIFSFKSKDNFKDPILSYVKDYSRALLYKSDYGPTFDEDLSIYVEEGYDNKNYDFDFIRCGQRSYEKKIGDTEDKILIDDCEVFQILERDH